MQHEQAIWNTPVEVIARLRPDEPIACFCPQDLQASYQSFDRSFDGLVTYAVKANMSAVVLENLCAMGMRAFDVASPAEMRAVRTVCPEAFLHYHNPVRSVSEIAAARALGVRVWSVDSGKELSKIAPGAQDEISVRLALPVKGAAYDFGAKFGADEETCAQLLREVTARGARASLTFHPGTQCADPSAWEIYIRAASEVAAGAGITLHRLNIGGGFAADRNGGGVDIGRIMGRINAMTKTAFAMPPKLVCEPGRALVSEAFTLITRIKAIRGSNAVFLNDGIYGGLAEMRDMPVPGRYSVHAPDGNRRTGADAAQIVFGPTCDSVDRLPGLVRLPNDTLEGDYVVFPAMGAYSLALSTAFNGYGVNKVVTVKSGMPTSGQTRVNP